MAKQEAREAVGKRRLANASPAADQPGMMKPAAPVGVKSVSSALACPSSIARRRGWCGVSLGSLVSFMCAS
jgi:hypothetical protein